MARFSLIGSTYTSQSPNVADQLNMNWYQENVEVPDLSPAVLYPTPGTILFCDLVTLPVRGSITVNDRTFTVGGAVFYEVHSNGSVTNYGSVTNDNLPVSMSAGTTQILIASAGNPYVFNFSTNTFTVLPGGTLLGQIAFAGYSDGYFIALIKDSNQFQISAINDALTWDALDETQVSEFPGNVLSMLVDHREIWLWGERQSIVYADTGAEFPFEPIPGAFIEAGIYAPNSPVRLDNSIFWLGGDERGAGVVWRASGYTPTRVSNHAVEFALQGYLQTYGISGLNDAVGYSYQDQGHSFYVLFFKRANATWVFDVAVGQWHQRGFWNASTGQFSAHHSQNHTFNFGKHLVGDWSSGKLYDMAINYYTDGGSTAINGNPIRRVRRSPHVSDEQKYLFHSQLQVYCESGIGPIPPLQGTGGTVSTISLEDTGGTLWTISADDNGLLTSTNAGAGTAPALYMNDEGNTTSWLVGITTDGLLTATSVTFNSSYPTSETLSDGVTAWTLTVATSGLLQTTQNFVDLARGPYLNMRFSDDGGHVWSNEQTADAGQAGQYSKRVMFRRLGRSRSRVYEVSCSDPVPWRLLAAYLETIPGNGS